MTIDRATVEQRLKDARDWTITSYKGLSEEQLTRPLTRSQHDPENNWTALDHFAHLALIEHDFARFIRRHISGHERPINFLHAEDGATLSREQIMAKVHASTEAWQQEHHAKSLDEVIELTGTAREATLALLSELSDDQIGESLPGAPWGDGTLGGVLAANADHARGHWHWVLEAGLLDPDRPKP